jgi:hypothetical protein
MLGSPHLHHVWIVLLERLEDRLVYRVVCLVLRVIIPIHLVLVLALLVPLEPSPMYPCLQHAQTVLQVLLVHRMEVPLVLDA